MNFGPVRAETTLHEPLLECVVPAVLVPPATGKGTLVYFTTTHLSSKNSGKYSVANRKAAKARGALRGRAVKGRKMNVSGVPPWDTEHAWVP